MGGRKRGLLVGCTAWLSVILGWFAWKRGCSSNNLPYWWEALVALEAAPFLLGVFVYFVRDKAAWCRPYLPIAGALLVAGSWLPSPGDTRSLSLAAGCAVLVWYALVATPLGADNPLVQHGDRTYGLYLLHIPLLALAASAPSGLGRLSNGNATIVVITLAVLLAGLLCGELELRLYRWVQARFLPARAPAVAAAEAAHPARLAA